MAATTSPPTAIAMPSHSLNETLFFKITADNNININGLVEKIRLISPADTFSMAIKKPLMYRVILKAPSTNNCFIWAVVGKTSLVRFMPYIYTCKITATVAKRRQVNKNRSADFIANFVATVADAQNVINKMPLSVSKFYCSFN